MFNIFNLLMKKDVKVVEDIKDIKGVKGKNYFVLKKEFDNNECIICLDNMIKNDHINMLNCGHMYHNKCISDWFAVKKECPICYK